MAKKLFPDEDPVNKIVKINDDLPEKVVGVYKDFPLNSSFNDVSFIAPFFDLTSWVNGNEDSWYNESFQVFVQLAANADMKKVSAKIKDIKLAKIDAQTAKIEKPQMLLQPMSKWHLYSDFKNGVNTGGAIRYVRMFAIIGLFVLLLACINFMNLSTARSEKRAKEVGIRKAIGSLRSQLIKQFFSESLLMAMFAFVCCHHNCANQYCRSLMMFQAKQLNIPFTNVFFWLCCIGFSVDYRINCRLISGFIPLIF